MNEHDKKLLLAAQIGDTNKMIRAHQNGGNVNVVLDETLNFSIMKGFTPLICAAKFGQLSCVKKLIELGANVNYQTNDKETALGEAAYLWRFECARYLLDCGADPNIILRDNENAMLLSYGIHNDGDEHERDNLVKYFIEKGADINYQDQTYGYSVILHAVARSSIELFDFLVKRGADLSVKSRNEVSVMDVAVDNKRHDIIDYLSGMDQDTHLMGCIKTDCQSHHALPL